MTIQVQLDTLWTEDFYFSCLVQCCASYSLLYHFSFSFYFFPVYVAIPHMIITEYMSNGSLDHFLKVWNVCQIYFPNIHQAQISENISKSQATFERVMIGGSKTRSLRSLSYRDLHEERRPKLRAGSVVWHIPTHQQSRDEQLHFSSK